MTDNVDEMAAGELLGWMGTDAQRWTDTFLKMTDLANAGPDFQDTVRGWFANALGAGESAGRSSQYRRSIPHLAIQVNDTAHAKGWWDAHNRRLFDGVLMLIVSEAAEALEEWRNNRQESEVYYSIPDYRPDLTIFEDQGLRDRMYHLETSTFRKNISTGRLADDFSDNEVQLMIQTGYLKPEGIPSELADIVIRVFDCAVEYGIDIEEQIIDKMAYNATRPMRHGGKRS